MFWACKKSFGGCSFENVDQEFWKWRFRTGFNRKLSAFGSYGPNLWERNKNEGLLVPPPENILSQKWFWWLNAKESLVHKGIPYATLQAKWIYCLQISHTKPPYSVSSLTWCQVTRWSFTSPSPSKFLVIFTEKTRNVHHKIWFQHI